MNHRWKWCFVAVLGWVVGALNNAIAYDYIESEPYYFADYEPPIDVHTATRTEEAEAKWAVSWV